MDTKVFKVLAMDHRGVGFITVYKTVVDTDVLYVGEAKVFDKKTKEQIGCFNFRDGSHWGAANKCVVAIDCFVAGVAYAKEKC